MINFACPKCNKKIKAPDSAAGKQANCPGCKSPINVPEPELVLEVDEPIAAMQQGLKPGFMTPNQVRPPKRGPSLLMVALFVLPVLFLFCSGAILRFIRNLPKPTAEQIAASKESAEYRSDARRLVRNIEDIVSKRLKAPKTAKFDLDCQIKQFGTEIVAIVDGNVTSQNEFAAMLTKPVKAMFVKQGSEFKLTSYVFEDTNLVVNQEMLDLAIKAMQETQKK